MADILTPSTDPLHKLMDKVEKFIDDGERRIADLETQVKAVGATTPEIEQVRESLQQQVGVLEDVKERMDALDRILPQGSKVYSSATAPQTSRSEALRNDLARGILDLTCITRSQRPRFDSWVGRAQAETTNSGADGGYLVPTEHHAEIIRIVESYGVARRICRQLPMKHREMNLPTNSAGPTVYWDTDLGALENSAPTGSSVTFGQSTLTAHKLIAIDTISIEVDEDSIPAIRDFLLDIFAIAVAKEEDTACLIEPTAAPFQGVMYQSDIVTATTTSASNTYLAALQATGVGGGYDLLLQTMDGADHDVQDTGVWVMSNSVLNAVRQVTDAGGMPLWGQMASGAPNTLFGRPIFRSRVMPKVTDAGSQASTPFIIYGDFRYHIMGDRRALSFEVSPHAAFTSAGLVLRLMERVAFKTVLPAAFSTLTTHA